MIKYVENETLELPNHVSLDRKPWWMKKKRSLRDKNHMDLDRLVRDLGLNTVCRSADCPNRGECWGRGTATFMILGNTCTRSCTFCDIATGRPEEIDPLEPQRVAEAVARLELDYVVITSVNRDERRDGGAPHFAETIRAIRNSRPGCRVEVLTPDFKGSMSALRTVADARPDVFNHNIETVPRLYRSIQPQAKYQRSLDVLYAASTMGLVTKSGIILGMGEELDEVSQVLADLRESDVDIVTTSKNFNPVVQELMTDG